MTYMFDDPDRCEECGSRDFLEDSIVGGRGMRLCPNCIKLGGALVIKKLDNPDVEIKRTPVRERLAKMAGISLKNRPEPTREYQSPVSLDDLRKRYEEVKRKRAEAERAKAVQQQPEVQKAKVLDTREFLSNLEKENPEMAQELLEQSGTAEPKVPLKERMAKFFGKFKIKRAKKEEPAEAAGQEQSPAPEAAGASMPIAA